MTGNDILNGIARGASSLASMGLQAISGTAGVAKQATLAIGGAAATAMAIDSYVYLSYGLTSPYHAFNECKTAVPTIINFFEPIKSYSKSHCEEIKASSELFFQKQILLFPVVVAGIALTSLAFKKIESGAAHWQNKLSG